MHVLRKTTTTDLAIEPTAPRETPRPTTPFREVMGRSASALVQQAEAALTRLPGGPVLAAAMRGGGPTPAGAGAIAAPTRQAMANSLPPQGPAATTGANGSATTAAEGPAPKGSGDAIGALARPGGDVEGALQSSQDMNLYYLQLQEAMAAENRAYTATSNVLKARHDTVKNAIGNLR